jgi:RHS repeat-associated protein
VTVVHLRARDYDPTTATFLSKDPAMEGPGGMYGSEPGTPTEANPYHYVSNDPLNFTDPLGLCRTTDVTFSGEGNVVLGPRTGPSLEGCQDSNVVECGWPGVPWQPGVIRCGPPVSFVENDVLSEAEYESECPAGIETGSRILGYGDYVRAVNEARQGHYSEAVVNAAGAEVSRRGTNALWSLLGRSAGLGGRAASRLAVPVALFATVVNGACTLLPADYDGTSWVPRMHGGLDFGLGGDEPPEEYMPQPPNMTPEGLPQWPPMYP